MKGVWKFTAGAAVGAASALLAAPKTGSEIRRRLATWLAGSQGGREELPQPGVAPVQPVRSLDAAAPALPDDFQRPVAAPFLASPAVREEDRAEVPAARGAGDSTAGLAAVPPAAFAPPSVTEIESAAPVSETPAPPAPEVVERAVHEVSAPELHEVSPPATDDALSPPVDLPVAPAAQPGDARPALDDLRARIEETRAAVRAALDRPFRVEAEQQPGAVSEPTPPPSAAAVQAATVETEATLPEATEVHAHTDAEAAPPAEAAAERATTAPETMAEPAEPAAEAGIELPLGPESGLAKTAEPGATFSPEVVAAAEIAPHLEAVPEPEPSPETTAAAAELTAAAAAAAAETEASDRSGAEFDAGAPSEVTAPPEEPAREWSWSSEADAASESASRAEDQTIWSIPDMRTETATTETAGEAAAPEPELPSEQHEPPEESVMQTPPPVETPAAAPAASAVRPVTTPERDAATAAALELAALLESTGHPWSSRPDRVAVPPQTEPAPEAGQPIAEQVEETAEVTEPLAPAAAEPAAPAWSPAAAGSRPAAARMPWEQPAEPEAGATPEEEITLAPPSQEAGAGISREGFVAETWDFSSETKDEPTPEAHPTAETAAADLPSHTVEPEAAAYWTPLPRRDEQEPPANEPSAAETAVDSSPAPEPPEAEGESQPTAEAARSIAEPLPEVEIGPPAEEIIPAPTPVEEVEPGPALVPDLHVVSDLGAAGADLRAEPAAALPAEAETPPAVDSRAPYESIDVLAPEAAIDVDAVAEELAAEIAPGPEQPAEVPSAAAQDQTEAEPAQEPAETAAVNQAEMRKRIEETRSRLKAKAFDAMTSGEGALLARESESQPVEGQNAPLEADVEQALDRSLSQEDY